MKITLITNSYQFSETLFYSSERKGGLSQEQAAETCHIPLQKWLNLEEGTVWPEKNTMFQICRRLNFSREDFIARFIQFNDSVIAKYKNPSYADSSTSQPV